MSGKAKNPVEPRFDNPEADLESYLVLQRERSARGESKTQNEWIEHYAQDDEWDFPSSAQYYQIFKQIQEENDAELLEALREDWNQWTVASTRIAYEANSLDATVMHNYDSGNQSNQNVKVPDYQGVYFNQIPDQQEAEDFLQALFDTEDGFEDIAEVLEYVSGKPMDKLKLWTLSQDGRSLNSERSVFLYYGGDGFLVGCYYHPDGYGFSRGVRER